MEDQLVKKLILFMDNSKNKLKSTQFSIKMKWLMFWELLEVKDSKESLKDGELSIFKKNHIEVIEKLVVSDHGIQQE